MKIRIAAIAILLLLPLVTVAQHKNPDYPPVYNLTGTLNMWVQVYDSTATVTVDGQTSFAGCNTTGTSVDCSDVAGGLTAKLADGRTVPVIATWSLFRLGKWFTDDWENVSGSILVTPSLNNPTTFQYRLMTITGKNNLMAGSYFCVPSSNKKKFGMYEEVCQLMN
jgi:hypothetical protein